MQRIGLFIGDFDPFHKGHHSICEYMIDNNILDVILIHIIRLEKGEYATRYRDRLNMIFNQLYTSKYFGSDPTNMTKISVIDDENSHIKDIIKNVRDDSKLNKTYLIVTPCLDLLQDSTQFVSIDEFVDEYIVIKLSNDAKKISHSFSGKPLSVYEDVPNQESPFTEFIRDGDHRFIAPKNIEYIQNNHLYELSRISKLGYEYIELELMNDVSLHSSVYKLTQKDKEIIYVTIGYTADQKNTDAYFKQFAQVETKYVHNNILIISNMRGYLLADLLGDKTKVFMSFENFELIGIAVGKFVKKIHTTKTFDSDPNDLDAYKIMCKMCNDKHLLKSFKKNPGKLCLIHGNLCAYNIFVNFPVKSSPQFLTPILTSSDEIEIIPIDSDNYTSTSKTGGFPAYEYYKFINSVWRTSRKALNNVHFIKGFIIGYDNIASLSPSHTTSICRMIWSL